MSSHTIKTPPTLGLMGMIILAAAVAAQFLPPGSFDREDKVIRAAGSSEVVHVVAEGESLGDVIAASGNRFTTAADVIDPGTGNPVAEVSAGQEVVLRVPKTSTREVVVPGTYTPGARERAGGPVAWAGSFLGSIFSAPIQGFRDKASIIAFILLIGGAFGILIATGAIDAALRAAVGKLEASHLGWAAIPACMVLFSFGGAVFGMSEEVIPFVMITIPLALRLGYDSITGLCMSFVGAGLGFAGAFMNPFTVQIAQGIADIQPISGWQFRVVAWVLITAIGIAYTMRWAAKVKRTPTASPVYESDQRLAHKFEAEGRVETRFGARDAGVLVTLAAGLVLIVWGVTKHAWYMTELSAVFVAIGVVGGAVGGLGLGRAVDAFVKGAGDLVGAALIVAFAAGVVVVLGDANVLDTILHAIAGVVGQTGPEVGACLMFVFQTLLNFFVPSGSGQAAMTMPLMAPLSDLIGVTRQTAVLAYQFGDGFGNMIIPTSAVTMSVLGIAEIPWTKWAKWLLPLEVILFVFGFAALVLAVSIGYA